MRKIGFLLICLIMFFGCTYQKPMVLEVPTTPRIVIKEIPAGPKKEKKEEYCSASYLYPDPCQGYIENQAYPYLPKIWLLREGGPMILLIGPEKGPPEFSIKGIREFSLPPGEHAFRIERWQYFPHYGGWKKIRQVEIVKIQIAQFPRTGYWHYWANSHYGWWVIIRPDHSVVYSGYKDY